MTPVNSRPAELALPVVAISAVRHALTQHVGADAAAHALRAAGNAAGGVLFRSFAYTPGAETNGSDETEARATLSELSGPRFWERLSVFFSSRGWGHLNFDATHPGVGALDTADWVEAEPASASRPSCFFTTGLLAGLLSRVTGAEIAVLEVECRAQGHARCRFLFGGPQALEAVFRDIATGKRADESLAALS
jgi:hypothetical protein